MKILFTGGGSGGHVTPNVALIKELKKDKNVEIAYVGSHEGIEKSIIGELGIPYKAIETGKLRRYLSKKNIEDFFKVFKGINEARKIIKEEKPDVVFSKGGFVSVPVVIGAAFNKVPVVIHESDLTPGLANKIALPFATKICVSFPETLEHTNKKKSILTGIPVRSEILDGDSKRGYEFTGFDSKKPVILVMGGSLGAEPINKAIREIVKDKGYDYQIVHLCGKGKLDESLKNVKGYAQFEYVSDELKDIFKITDIMITRAGATSLFELLLLKKPNILIPLTRRASRGDQILNAKSFEKNGYSYVIDEDEMTTSSLNDAIRNVLKNRVKYENAMKKSSLKNGTEKIIEVIKSASKIKK